MMQELRCLTILLAVWITGISWGDVIARIRHPTYSEAAFDALFSELNIDQDKAWSVRLLFIEYQHDREGLRRAWDTFNDFGASSTPWTMGDPVFQSELEDRFQRRLQECEGIAARLDSAFMTELLNELPAHREAVLAFDRAERRRKCFRPNEITEEQVLGVRADLIDNARKLTLLVDASQELQDQFRQYELALDQLLKEYETVDFKYSLDGAGIASNLRPARDSDNEEFRRTVAETWAEINASRPQMLVRIRELNIAFLESTQSEVKTLAHGQTWILNASRDIHPFVWLLDGPELLYRAALQNLHLEAPQHSALEDIHTRFADDRDAKTKTIGTLYSKVVDLRSWKTRFVAQASAFLNVPFNDTGVVNSEAAFQEACNDWKAKVEGYEKAMLNVLTDEQRRILGPTP